ncbi:MAG: hypothetical protein OSA78_08105, partial [Flavobacteriales bacterium]|nr:hypothetical protein [Flavobacteriales bacterium]
MNFLNTEFLGNPLSEWGIALGWALGGLIVGRLFYKWFSHRIKAAASKTASKLDDLIIDQVEEPIAMGVVILGLWFGYGHLDFGTGTDAFMGKVFAIALAFDITWL